jgi:hypothetical protein
MLKPIYLAPLLVPALLSTAIAQESATATQTSSLTITAAATGDAVLATLRHRKYKSASAPLRHPAFYIMIL